MLNFATVRTTAHSSLLELWLLWKLNLSAYVPPQVSSELWKSTTQTASSAGHGPALETVAIQAPGQPLPHENRENPSRAWLTNDTCAGEQVHFSQLFHKLCICFYWPQAEPLLIFFIHKDVFSVKAQQYRAKILFIHIHDTRLDVFFNVFKFLVLCSLYACLPVCV